MCVSDRLDTTLTVKVALNPKTKNQTYLRKRYEIAQNYGNIHSDRKVM